MGLVIKEGNAMVRDGSKQESGETRNPMVDPHRCRLHRPPERGEHVDPLEIIANHPEEGKRSSRSLRHSLTSGSEPAGRELGTLETTSSSGR